MPHPADLTEKAARGWCEASPPPLSYQLKQRKAMTMTSDLTPHERAHERAKREAIRKRVARLGFTLQRGPNAANAYMLCNAVGAMTFGDLDEVAAELRARRRAA